MNRITHRTTTRDFDDYVKRFPEDAQKCLVRMRGIIREAAPGAGEKISYGMPAFTMNGNLVWFGAHKNHIGFYPTASVIGAFEKELSAFKRSKGAVQFPFGQPLPRALVTRMVKFRVQQSLGKKPKQ